MRGDADEHHEVGRVAGGGQDPLALQGAVQRAVEVGPVCVLCGAHRLEIQAGGVHVEHLGLALREDLADRVPAAALDVEAVDVDALRRGGIVAARVHLQHLEVVAHLVDGDGVLPSIVLEGSRQEGGSEEEAWEPVHRRHALLVPVLQHFQPAVEVLQVGAQRAEGGIRHAFPQSGHLIDADRVESGLKVRTHHHQAVDGEVYVLQRVSNAGNQLIEAQHFLDKHGVHGLLVHDRVLVLHFLYVKVSGQLLQAAPHSLGDAVLNTPTVAAAAPTAAGGQQALEQQRGVGLILCDVRVFVQPKGLGLRDNREGGNVIHVSIDVALVGRHVEAAGRQLVHGIVHNVGAAALLEDGGEQQAVLVVRHATAVVAFACHVAQRVEWCRFVLIEEHLQLSDRDALVSIIEAVRNVPPQWSKLPPLLDERMEEYVPEEELLEGGGFVAALEELLVGNWLQHVAAAHVGSDALRRLVSHLHAILKDVDREFGAGVACHPQPELRVSGVRVQLLADAVQLRHPAGCQMAVLQHHPLALLQALVDHRLCLGPLPLP
mmetsp:Transcript_23705/g.65781  ORF Transcript_23705/g.65781 Transcript_23705/m.65781 type:complete len:546 (+) Transcript_23705:174-1811(+)